MKSKQHRAELRRLGVFFCVMLLGIAGFVWSAFSQEVRLTQWACIALSVAVLTLNVRLWNLAATVDELEVRLNAFAQAAGNAAASETGTGEEP